MSDTQSLDAAHGFRTVPVRLDGHVDLPRGENPVDGASLAKLREGGVNAVVLTVRADVHSPETQRTAGLADLESGYRAVLARLDDGYRLARTPDEVTRIVGDGGTALILALQNAAPFESVDELAVWSDRGLAVLGLDFIGNNRWSESSRPYPFANHPRGVTGLTALGADAVGWLNRVGVIVDVSQLSDRAVDDVLDVSTAPVIASHTGLRRTVDIARNLPDELATRIARHGGLLQMVAFSMYLKVTPDDRLPGLIELWTSHGLEAPNDPRAYYSIEAADTSSWSDERFFEFLHEFHVVLRLEEPHASVRDFVDAIDQAIDLVGIDHVGLSSDFNHGGGLSDWIDAAQTGHVVSELHSRGHDDAEIDKIFGGNFLTLWQRVREHADENGAPTA